MRLLERLSETTIGIGCCMEGDCKGHLFIYHDEVLLNLTTMRAIRYPNEKLTSLSNRWSEIKI